MLFNKILQTLILVLLLLINNRLYAIQSTIKLDNGERIILLAQSINFTKYNNNNIVDAFGNITINYNSNIIKTEKALLETSNNTILLHGTQYQDDIYAMHSKFTVMRRQISSYYIVKLVFKNNIIIHSDNINIIDNIIYINHANYTTCQVESLKHSPLWSFSASKIIYDSNNNSINMSNIILKIKKAPALYIPKIILYTKRHAGIGVPTYSHSSSTNGKVTLPIFIPITNYSNNIFLPEYYIQKHYYSVSWESDTNILNGKIYLTSNIALNTQNDFSSSNPYYIDLKTNLYPNNKLHINAHINFLSSMDYTYNYLDNYHNVNDRFITSNIDFNIFWSRNILTKVSTNQSINLMQDNIGIYEDKYINLPNIQNTLLFNSVLGMIEIYDNFSVYQNKYIQFNQHSDLYTDTEHMHTNQYNNTQLFKEHTFNIIDNIYLTRLFPVSINITNGLYTYQQNKNNKVYRSHSMLVTYDNLYSISQLLFNIKYIINFSLNKKVFINESTQEPLININSAPIKDNVFNTLSERFNSGNNQFNTNLQLSYGGVAFIEFPKMKNSSINITFLAHKHYVTSWLLDKYYLYLDLTTPWGSIRSETQIANIQLTLLYQDIFIEVGNNLTVFNINYHFDKLENSQIIKLQNNININKNMTFINNISIQKNQWDNWNMYELNSNIRFYNQCMTIEFLVKYKYELINYSDQWKYSIRIGFNTGYMGTLKRGIAI